MKSATPLMLGTLVIALAGVLASPSALAGSGKHASLPGPSTFTYGENASMPDYSSFVSTTSRADVRAEAIAARRASVFTYGENASMPDPSSFVSTKTRAEVVAELREAQRLGLLPSRGDAAEPLLPTPEQLRLIGEAGQRAAADRIAATR